MDILLYHIFVAVSMLISISQGVRGSTFTFINKCDFTIWPGILGTPSLITTGFELPKSGSRSIQAQPGWSGRFWARTGCTFDGSGQGSCSTGDCGSGRVECDGSGAAPPATLAEFTLGSGAQDFYDVSLVDGYNLPMLVEPSGGSGPCGLTGCQEMVDKSSNDIRRDFYAETHAETLTVAVGPAQWDPLLQVLKYVIGFFFKVDLNRLCPMELQVVGGGACKSACEAFGTPDYCCSGTHSSPDTCAPSMYSQLFKNACPRSYSYAYDDATSTFTCTGADYTITFCPSVPSQKSSNDLPNSNATTDGYGSQTGSGDTTSSGNGSWLADLATAIGDSTTIRPSHYNLIFSLIFSTICMSHSVLHV